jgi:hypothetical protein
MRGCKTVRRLNRKERCGGNDGVHGLNLGAQLAASGRGRVPCVVYDNFKAGLPRNEAVRGAKRDKGVHCFFKPQGAEFIGGEEEGATSLCVASEADAPPMMIFNLGTLKHRLGVLGDGVEADGDVFVFGHGTDTGRGRCAVNGAVAGRKN